MRQPRNWATCCSRSPMRRASSGTTRRRRCAVHATSLRRALPQSSGSSRNAVWICKTCRPTRSNLSGSAQSGASVQTNKVVKLLSRYAYVLAILTALLLAAGKTNASSPGGLDRVNHIIVLTQENHSFDNYLGTLPWARDTHYHAPARAGDPCDPHDHQCVDGLNCSAGADGDLSCSNDNPLDGRSVTVSHQTNYCTCNPVHEWIQAHLEANFSDPNSSSNLGDGFARANVPNKTATAMSYYTDADLPYYYALAETFAVSDRHFSSVVGPTLPNRMYLMAATSFGHVLTNKVDNTPPVRSGYRPRKM